MKCPVCGSDLYIDSNKYKPVYRCVCCSFVKEVPEYILVKLQGRY